MYHNYQYTVISIGEDGVLSDPFKRDGYFTVPETLKVMVNEWNRQLMMASRYVYVVTHEDEIANLGKSMVATPPKGVIGWHSPNVFLTGE